MGNTAETPAVRPYTPEPLTADPSPGASPYNISIKIISYLMSRYRCFDIRIYNGQPLYIHKIICIPCQ